MSSLRPVDVLHEVAEKFPGVQVMPCGDGDDGDFHLRCDSPDLADRVMPILMQGKANGWITQVARYGGAIQVTLAEDEEEPEPDYGLEDAIRNAAALERARALVRQWRDTAAGGVWQDAAERLHLALEGRPMEAEFRVRIGRALGCTDGESAERVLQRARAVMKDKELATSALAEIYAVVKSHRNQND